MSFTTVTTYTTKLSKVTKSDCICCAERRIITNLKREFLKKGYKNHQFASWFNRKCGTLVIRRKTSYGDGISLPCVICRKLIEKYDIKWIAYDGTKWINSYKDLHLPKSVPTNKQRRKLGFGLND